MAIVGGLVMDFSYHETSLIDQSTIEEIAQRLIPYIKELKEKTAGGGYDFPEASLQLPFDDTLLTEVEALVEQKESDELRAVVVVGIGGANLGTWAIYDALKHRGFKRRLLFAETVDPVSIGNVLTELEKIYAGGGHVLLTLISKSGSTTETIANYGVIVEKLVALDPNWTKRIVVITNERSKLWDYAGEHKFSRLSIPAQVSGRYSVLSSVGLLPLTLAGINLTGLEGAARKAIEDGPKVSVEENSALASAAILYHHFLQGRTSHNTFFFAPQLRRVGQWYRQLVGESLGKEGKGITPLVSIGTTDLHSQLQLYLDGPEDKFTTFVRLKDFGVDQVITAERGLNELAEDIEGKTMAEVMDAIYQGVTAIYRKQGLPFVEIELEAINAHELGYFLQTKMLETIFLGRLMGINPFDQPAVEAYKTTAREILATS